MLLRRGYVVLIGGGAITIASFAMSVFLLIEHTYSIQPDDRLVIQRFVSNDSKGVYNISFPLFEGQAHVEILDPLDQTIVEQTISPPLVNEVFSVEQSGNYTLIVTNPSSEATLEASILFGDRDSYATQEQLIFSFLLYGGIIALIAGAAITILDRRRISKMKQFGDTSDLV